MSMYRRIGLICFMVAGFALGGASSASASFVLTLSDGTTTQIVADNQGVGFATAAGLTTVADASPIVGDVLFMSSVGQFLVNTTTGLSKPIEGGPLVAMMDLNSVNVNSPAPGTLTIKLTDTGFTFPSPALSGVFSSHIGGTLPTGATLAANYYVDQTNAEFGTAQNPANSGPFGPGPTGFSDNEGPVVVPLSGGPFSMTQTITIVFTTAGTVSFDSTHDLAATPEPATLGGGLVGLCLAGGLVWRRRAWSKLAV